MKNKKQKDLLEICYQKSISLLHANANKAGILACSVSPKAKEREYLSVFGRDASISSMGMVSSHDKKLIAVARRSLITLSKYQAQNGQIPNYVIPKSKYVDFYYVGCVDATLWWLIAIKYFDRNAKSKKTLSELLRHKIEKALFWLQAQQHPKFFLLTQNEASDWADIMPRTGFVLYSNSLWYEVKKIYKLKNKEKTKMFFNYFFDPNKKVSHTFLQKDRRLKHMLKYIKKRKTNSLFYSYINFGRFGAEGDVYGNLLACITGLASKSKCEQIVDLLINKNANKLYPVRATVENIEETSFEWKKYMERHNLNYPYQYHNGGIWPFIGGFWCIALSYIGKNDMAWADLHKLACANSVGGWQFYEWFNGKTGEACGMRGQTWNAAMYVLAYNFLKKQEK